MISTWWLYAKHDYLSNMKSWKCYRCDLTFKQEQHADIHHDITNHPFNQIGV